MKFHKLADIFPLLSGDEFDKLSADIKTNGLLEPIWLYEGAILDGRNRFLACKDARVDPEFRQYVGDDPLGLVVSLNIHRRHLTVGQRAMIADDLIPLHEAAAKARMMAGKRISPVPNSEQGNTGRSAERVATQMGVGKQSVFDAKKLKAKSPELAAKVRTGELSLNAATKQLSKPHVSHNSGDNEWYTPPEYIEAARAVMGEIDLDPASTALANETIRAARYYSKQDNALEDEHDWWGRVWMNPPYSQPEIEQFCQKLNDSVIDGLVDEAIVLVNNATETKWFRVLTEIASAVCFVNGRVKFLDTQGNPGGAPLQGQAIVYIGAKAPLFKDRFENFGKVWYAG